MSAASAIRVILIYFLAVLVASVLATIVQTQINLNDLQSLDVQISTQDRLETTGADLLNFLPLMALLSAVSFIVALPVAEFIGRVLKPMRPLIYFLAGAVGIWAAFRVTDMIAPPPTFIAATRDVPGLLLMMVMVGLGSLLFALLTRPKTKRGLRVLG